MGKFHRSTLRNIYVKSERAGKRVLQSITKFLDRKLRLKVNQTKSAVDRPSNRKFLGFTITNSGEISIAKDSIKRIKNKIRIVTSRNRGKNIELIMCAEHDVRAEG